jgi:hypothetical protein
MKTLIALLTFLPIFAFSIEREKREYKPILPINVKSIDFQEQKDLGKKLELPKHDPKRVYYGPENSLFPKLDLSSFEEIKINR